MPIADTDLLLYCAADHPDDDSDSTGGAIDITMRPEFTQFAAPAVVALISDGTDTRVATLVFRDATGAIDTEDVTLTSAVEVVSVATVERLLSITMDGPDAARTVTVKEGSGGTTRGTIPPDEVGFTACFIASASAVGAVTRHEKIFWLNNHGSLTLNSAEVTLTGDPSSRIKMGLCVAKNDSTSIANRLATPAGVSFVDDNVAQGVPTGAMAAGDRIGVWIKQELQAADSPFKSTFTTKLAGVSA